MGKLTSIDISKTWRDREFSKPVLKSAEKVLLETTIRISGANWPLNFVALCYWYYYLYTGQFHDRSTQPAHFCHRFPWNFGIGVSKAAKNDGEICRSIAPLVAPQWCDKVGKFFHFSPKNFFSLIHQKSNFWEITSNSSN